MILALDVEDRRAAFELLDLVGEDIDVIKFNYPLILSEGISLIGEIKDRYHLPILADFKVADVPVTNNRIIRICREAGADGIMVHGFIGIDAIQSAIEEAGDLKVFVVSQLSNPGGMDYTAQFTEEFAGLARMLGAAGVQAPGNRPEGPGWGSLQRGEELKLDDGRVIRPDMVLGAARPGRKVVFITDTQPCGAVVELAREADLLFIEGMFAQELSEDANQKGHQTALQAARQARQAGAKRAVLIHFSPRYSDEELGQLVGEARSEFSPVEAGADLSRYELPVKNE